MFSGNFHDCYEFWKSFETHWSSICALLQSVRTVLILPITDCKNLAPIYEELAQNFQHAENKLNIAKVDADEHKELGRKYGVQGFPTLKWFDGKSKEPQDYNMGRDLDSLSNFITEQTGIKPKSNKPPSHIRMLKDSTFNDTIGGEAHVLVAFTAPWCGRKDQSSYP